MAFLLDGLADRQLVCREHRKYPNVGAHLHATLSNGGCIMSEGCVDDLSVGGCALSHTMTVAPGDHLAVHLALPDHDAPTPLTIELATVRWARQQNCGIEFMAMTGTTQARLLRYVSLCTQALESAILRQVQTRFCTIEELLQVFPMFTWNQIFSTVDRLSRNGTIVLRRLAPLAYAVVSVPALPTCRGQTTDG